MRISNQLFLLLMGLLFLTATSCVNTRKTAYFVDVPKDLIVASPAPDQQLIHPGDILAIQVSSPNPEATTIFNNNSSTALNGTNAIEVTGYLVDPEGNIQFPMLGKIKAGMLTKRDLTDQIRNQLLERKLLLEPVVSIRFLNFRVTVLGEVEHPQVVPVPSEKISILEALGAAGDLTIYGRRDNLLLIRDEGGQKMLTRIDLNSKELLSSPYFYLHNGDVLYAEPNKARVGAATNTRQLLPIILSGLSFVTIILDRLTR
ncbi:polysaccharide biosynthesis/export family protein [Flaviaesturariibacter aridisoli]|uniref:Polysaccharide export protein n=1 Tax=Flaviaesturariibacter aridisoli TaxID=2545761 RepID=A0A4R4E1Y8_9BACT|nr:polysaccharide biosynthesis/export family protein [Flaviaesturariibacter aridisoli]TCZ69064.1 polysaccharide export protein [Flaviaesturariibacter aridisoli]